MTGQNLLPTQGRFLVKLKIGADKPVCSGVLVRNRWVLTARGCVNNVPASSIKASVWGVDGNLAPYRTVRAVYHRELPPVIITHRLRKYPQERETDDLVYLLLHESAGDDNIAYLTFNPINDKELEFSYNYLELMGVGRASYNGPIGASAAKVHFDTHRFDELTASWFIMSAGSIWYGLTPRDIGGAALIDTASGGKELVGIAAGSIFVSGASDYNVSIRLSAHRDEAISIMGWSDREPWRWEPSSSTMMPPPTSFRYHQSLPDIYLCRDSDGQSGLLATDESALPGQKKCFVVNDDCDVEANDQYEILTGSLFEYFSWSDSLSFAPETGFTAMTPLSEVVSCPTSAENDTPEDTSASFGASGSPAAAKPYCMAGTSLGILHNSNCILADGTGNSEYQVLVLNSVLDSQQMAAP